MFKSKLTTSAECKPIYKGLHSALMFIVKQLSSTEIAERLFISKRTVDTTSQKHHCKKKPQKYSRYP